MTTATHVMTGLDVRAIGADVVRELRVTDDAGNRPRLLVDSDGGSPLRCCLLPVRPGERVALVSYAPLRRWARETGAAPGPYEETGPVFIHPEPCGGPDGPGFPVQICGGRRVFRTYSPAGSITGGLLVEPGQLARPGEAERILARQLEDPDVALVHVRAVEYGCFLFEVRRA
jgi:hypothetical protein